MAETKRILFLCTGNSARSILAEALLNRMGEGRFLAFSAGSYPKGKVHPAALALLGDKGFPTAHLRSKSWDAFAGSGAPPLDFIITVCDNAAGEICPVWPGRPMAAHWGIADPADVEGPGQREAFERAFAALERRISQLLALPLDGLDPESVKAQLRAIGETQNA